MSEYDLLRLSNINRNEEYLKCLGLDGCTSKLENGKALKAGGLKRKAIALDNADESGGTRQSCRISSITNSVDEKEEGTNIIPSEEDSIRYKLSAEQLRSFIEKENSTASKQISNEVCIIYHNNIVYYCHDINARR